MQSLIGGSDRFGSGRGLSPPPPRQIWKTTYHSETNSKQCWTGLPKPNNVLCISPGEMQLMCLLCSVWLSSAQCQIVLCINCLNFHTVPALCKALVRLKMELAVQAWSPYLKKDINKLEKAQRHAKKLIPCLSHLSYEEILDQLNLTTLEERRSRGDMITVFKILNGFDRISENFLELDTGAKGT